MENKKRVMFFTHNLNHGGAEKAVRSLSTYINENVEDIESFICVVYDDPEVRKSLSNVIVMKHKSRRDDNKFVKAINVLRQIREMRNIKKRYKIDVCISFLPGADIINVLSGVGERQIVSVRNIESLFTHNIFKKIYVKTSYKRCDHIVAVSDTVRGDVIDFFGIDERKVTTIPNAAPDIKKGRSVDSDVVEFIKDSKTIINVGRLADEKGQEHLIRAFDMALRKMDAITGDGANSRDNEIKDIENKNVKNKERQKLKLVILGDGPRREYLQNLINERGLADKVMLCGNKKNPGDYMELADIFVLSSNTEGMPNVLLEAMQCGLPCISTECGAREILAPSTSYDEVTSDVDIAEYGILVPTCEDTPLSLKLNKGVHIDAAKNEEILADAIVKMATDEKLMANYREKDSNRIKDYSMQVIISKWFEVL